MTEWLEEKRRTGKLKTRGQPVCVSPEVYAHWTLSKTESEGIEDERNKKKMIGICNELKITYESNPQLNIVTQQCSESEDQPSGSKYQEVEGNINSVTPDTSKQKGKISIQADEGNKKKKQPNATILPKELNQGKTKISHSKQGSSESEDLSVQNEQKSLEAEEVRESTKSVTCGASKQKSKTSSKSDGGNKKRKVQNPTRSSKESTQMKKKITQRTQGSSESEDIPSEFEECSLDQQKVRGSMKDERKATSHVWGDVRYAGAAWN